MCLEFQNAQFRFKTTGGLAPNCYVTSLSHAFFPKNQKNPSVSLSLQRKTWALICFMATTANSSSLLVLLFLLHWFRYWKMIVGGEGKRPRLMKSNYNPAEMTSRNSARTNLIKQCSGKRGKKNNLQRKRKIITSLYLFQDDRLYPRKVMEQYVLNICNVHTKARELGSACRIEQPKPCVSNFLTGGWERSKILSGTQPVKNAELGFVNSALHRVEWLLRFPQPTGR